MSEAVAQRLIGDVFGEGMVGNRLGRKGSGYLIKRMASFRQMANREPVLILTDLDRANCPPELLQKWSNGLDFPENLLIRVVVREIEAWVLADRNGTADFLGVSPNLIPLNPEEIADPKSFLLNIARRARREVRAELIVSKGAVASQGLGYNRTLSSFVAGSWSLEKAILASASLSKAMLRLRELADRLPH